MPRPAIRIDLRIRRLGQRTMHALAVSAMARRGRPPSARADDGTAPAPRARSARRPRQAPPRRRRSRAARPRATARSTSPTGSAAAVSSSRRVSSGSDWSSPRGSSARCGLPAGRGSGSPKPPASSAGRQPAGQLQQRERVAARLGDDPVPHSLVQPPGDRRRQQRARIVVAEPPTTSSGRPASSRSSLGSRTANTNATGSAISRRATNARVCTDARSSHCASSTQADERPLARPPRTAGSSPPDRRGSDPERPRPRPNAVPQRIALRARQLAPAARASARTAAAARRTRAPSRTPRPQLARCGTPTPALPT